MSVTIHDFLLEVPLFLCLSFYVCLATFMTMDAHSRRSCSNTVRHLKVKRKDKRKWA